ncbi:zinc ribbon domain-containing protein [Paraburkholderia panacisoli]|uniref:Zinc ribbon domain-containing protein n=1 Tax=Paraburkholderia panacisoli TaxID=2603818 RepID=A0A5B0GJ28_9BURK|nr:zinc ribbon domain-containing protein [Paraburkholderia panacisoli]KAA1003447.1 zinc ribbon domain-containing protein [Paraburkholderia panacisoli]
MIYIVGWLVVMLITALVANTKNRNPAAWALLAIPLGLIATIVVACSSKLNAELQQPLAGSRPNNRGLEALRQTEHTVLGSVSGKDCPQCAETVKGAARICRYCGHNFEPATGEA